MLPGMCLNAGGSGVGKAPGSPASLQQPSKAVELQSLKQEVSNSEKK